MGNLSTEICSSSVLVVGQQKYNNTDLGKARRSPSLELDGGGWRVGGWRGRGCMEGQRVDEGVQGG